MSLTDELYDFYDSSYAHWYAIYAASVTFFIMVSNLFFIFITLSSKTLLKIRANWFLVGLAVSDFLHGSAHHAGAWAILKGSIESRSACSIAGFFILMTGEICFTL